MHFEHEGVKIGMPESAYLLRINKQVGMFAVGMLDVTDSNSVATYGRGKWIELVIANCETGLFGTIGKAQNKEWSFVSAVVTKAEDKRLVPGLLLHFPVYGFEARDFSTMQSEAEIAAIFGDASKSAKVIRIEFTKSVSTQYGSTIKPPVISVKDADKTEAKYFNAAQRIITEHPQYVPSALDLFPLQADNKTGEIISGLIRLSDRSPSLSMLPGIAPGNGVAALPVGSAENPPF